MSICDGILWNNGIDPFAAEITKNNVIALGANRSGQRPAGNARRYSRGSVVLTLRVAGTLRYRFR